MYKNIILSTLATKQPLGYEIYNITLSTVAGFNNRTPWQPLFTETRLLKQPHMSRLITHH